MHVCGKKKAEPHTPSIVLSRCGSRQSSAPARATVPTKALCTQVTVCFACANPVWFFVRVYCSGCCDLLCFNRPCGRCDDAAHFDYDIISSSTERHAALRRDRFHVPVPTPWEDANGTPRRVFLRMVRRFCVLHADVVFLHVFAAWRRALHSLQQYQIQSVAWVLVVGPQHHILQGPYISTLPASSLCSDGFCTPTGTAFPLLFAHVLLQCAPWHALPDCDPLFFKIYKWKFG